MRALVVDDSRATRALMSRTLRELGFEVQEAGHGLEALDCLKSGPCPELALLDWNMPQMNGLELLQALRAQPAYAEMRVMMVTTETEQAQMARALLAGADEYLMKPFAREAVADKLSLLGFPVTA